MTNDAKLGMVAGVAGVVVAAVLLSRTPPAAPSKPESAEAPKGKLAAQPAPAAVTPAPPPQAGPAALPSSAVARTRKDVAAQAASRSAAADEEP